MTAVMFQGKGINGNDVYIKFDAEINEKMKDVKNKILTNSNPFTILVGIVGISSGLIALGGKVVKHYIPKLPFNRNVQLLCGVLSLVSLLFAIPKYLAKRSLQNDAQTLNERKISLITELTKISKDPNEILSMKQVNALWANTNLRPYAEKIVDNHSTAQLPYIFYFVFDKELRERIGNLMVKRPPNPILIKDIMDAIPEDDVRNAVQNIDIEHVITKIQNSEIK
jgi:hypothetical protein